MGDKFIPTRNSFILTCTNVWLKVDDWTEWQSVSKTSNRLDLTVSSIEINRYLVIYFHYAAREGDVSTMKELLEEGAPVDCADEFDRTALFRAALCNRTDVIRLLLQNGANINKQDYRGDTPVHRAAFMNSTEAIAVLMEHGASINIKNDDGEKPIDYARRWKYEAALRMLEQL